MRGKKAKWLRRICEQYGLSKTTYRQFKRIYKRNQKG